MKIIATWWVFLGYSFMLRLIQFSCGLLPKCWSCSSFLPALAPVLALAITCPHGDLDRFTDPVGNASTSCRISLLWQQGHRVCVSVCVCEGGRPAHPHSLVAPPVSSDEVEGEIPSRMSCMEWDGGSSSFIPQKSTFSACSEECSRPWFKPKAVYPERSVFAEQVQKQTVEGWLCCN